MSSRSGLDIQVRKMALTRMLLSPLRPADESSTRMRDAYFYWTVYTDVSITEGEWTSTGDIGSPTVVSGDRVGGVNPIVCRNETTGQLISEISVAVGDDLSEGQVTLDTDFFLLTAVGGEYVQLPWRWYHPGCLPYQHCVDACSPLRTWCQRTMYVRHLGTIP